MSATEFNKSFDQAILEDHLLTTDMVTKLDEAYAYDAASSMNWIIAKLKLVQEVINRSSIVSVETKTGVMFLNNESDFQAWVLSTYTDISSEFVER